MVTFHKQIINNTMLIFYHGPTGPDDDDPDGDEGDD